MGHNLEIRIDPDTREEKGSSHPVLITLFVLVILGVVAGAVWFLGFSEWGFSWSGNEAKIITQAPEEVVTSYPEVRLTINNAAIILESGTNATLEARINKTPSSKDIDLSDLRLQWHSENPSVAIVNHRGVVTSLNEGTARILVNVGNSDINSNTACCLVTVRPQRPLDKEEDEQEDK